MIEEKKLIFRFKRGNREALRGIYDKFKIDLLKLAVVLTNDVNAAEDIVHDVFLRFAQSAKRFKLTGSLKSYLVTSLVNRVRNIHRNRARHNLIQMDKADSVASSGRSPLQWAVLSEQITQLSQALQELPYEQREVICCRMEMDMTFRQIAALQQVSQDTVKGRYRYGLTKLRSLLNSKGKKCNPQMT